MSDSAIAVATAFVRAINRQDANELAGLMTVDHRFTDSQGNTMEGRDTMRDGWKQYFRMVPDYSLAIEETYTEGSVVLLLGLAQGTYSPDGKVDPENRWETPVAVRAQVEDGLMQEWRVYADNEPIRRLIAQRGPTRPSNGTVALPVQ